MLYCLSVEQQRSYDKSSKYPGQYSVYPMVMKCHGYCNKAGWTMSKSSISLRTIFCPTRNRDKIHISSNVSYCKLSKHVNDTEKILHKT